MDDTGGGGQNAGYYYDNDSRQFSVGPCVKNPDGGMDC